MNRLARAVVLGSALICATQAACQEPGIVTAPYAELRNELAGRVDFDTLGAGPEPGIEITQLAIEDGLVIGSHLRGQERRVAGAHFDIDPTDVPDVPLRLADQGTLAVAAHRGFGSAAVFPVGPHGASAVSGRGEGVLSVVFATGQSAFGLRVHSDYPDPLGLRPPPGDLVLQFYDRDGALIGVRTIELGRGIADLGFRAPERAIAAVTITNSDPGGVAFDDILFHPVARTG